jgi:hypothetical protein
MGRPQIASHAILPPKPKFPLALRKHPRGVPASTRNLVPGWHKFFVGVSKLPGFDRH